MDHAPHLGATSPFVRVLAVVDSLLWPAVVGAALWSIPVRGVVAMAAAALLLFWALRRGSRAAWAETPHKWTTLQWARLALVLFVLGAFFKSWIYLAR